MPNINSSSLKTLFDRFIKCATSSTSKASTSFSNEFSLLCATSFLQGQYHADITFSLHKLDKFSSFFSFSIKYISHLIFSVDIASSCMVFSSLDFLKWSLTASVLNRVKTEKNRLFVGYLFPCVFPELWFLNCQK